jgi:hypothetical protein
LRACGRSMVTIARPSSNSRATIQAFSLCGIGILSIGE